VTPRAASRLAKAEEFLAQLKSVSSTDVPARAIHLAYYSMLHAASAVLLDRFGEAPKTHAGTIGRFSQAVMANDEGRRFGRLLSKAEQLRMVSDYDDGGVPTAADAESTQYSHRVRRLLPLAALM
jgi:uncharacterized protein (UPF0332 family)